MCNVAGIIIIRISSEHTHREAPKRHAIMLRGPAHGYRHADVDAKHQTLLPLIVNAANASRSLDLTNSTLIGGAINTPIPVTLAYLIGAQSTTLVRDIRTTCHQ